MNLLHKALIAIRAIPPPQPLTWENLFPTRYVSSGVDVSEYSALNYSPIWCGVSTLSRDIAKLPLVLYKNLPNGGKERFTSHRLYRILHDEWNPEMSSYKARETMQALCLLYGNSYAEIVRDDLGRPVGMYPIVPTRVSPIRDEQTGRLFYRVMNVRGGQVFIAPQNMLHFSALSTDGIIGHGIVEHAKESIGLGIAAEKFGGAFFGNGTTFGGIVEIPVPLTLQNKEIATNTREAIEAVHQGVERAHKLLVLGAGTKFTPRGTAPNEAQFNESRKFQVTETARWLNMPAHKLGDLENAHFTNIEEQELQYYQGCVSGWLQMEEQEYRRKLIAPLEYSQQSIEHVMEGVLRGSSAQRADYYTKMFMIGGITINKMLQLENMNPIGPDGDVHMVPLNMIPLERLTEFINAQIEAKKAPKELPAPKVDSKEPEPDERTAKAIETAQARVTELLEQARRDSLGLIEKVTGKLDGEVRQHAETANAALEAQKAAEARAEAERVEKTRLEQEAETLRASIAAVEAAALITQQTLETTEQEKQIATEQVDVALAQKVAAETQADADRIAKEQAEQDAETLRAALAVAQAEVQTATEAREQALAQVTEAERAVLETTAKATTEAFRADTTAQERAVLASQAEDASRELASRTEALDKAQRDQAAAVAFGEALQARLDAATATITELEAVRTADRDRRARMIAAHRELFVDAVRRIARTETERARKRGGQPETLRKWIDAFYDEHGREIVSDILYPAVMAHLTWKRSDEEPRMVARQMANTYCDQSSKQLRALADGMVGDEFQAAFVNLLTRWEQERPTQLADQVLHEEISYLTAE